MGSIISMRTNVSAMRSSLRALAREDVIHGAADIAETRMLKHIAARAPRRTGAYASSFGRRRWSRGLRLVTKYGMLMRWLEYTGTRPHIIVPRRARVLHWIDDAGRDVFSMRVRHPGTSPVPHIRPGLRRVVPGTVHDYIAGLIRRHRWLRR